MIRRGLKRLAKRLTGQQPRVPGAASTGRAPPTTRADWQPPPATEPEPPVEEEPNIEVEAGALKSWVEDGADPIFLDIREPAELPSGIVEGAYLIPMNQIPDRIDELPRDRKLIVYCAAGVRSFGVTHWLREQGFEDTWSLIGGAGAWFYAGFDPHRPATDAPLALLRPVKIPAETLEAHDISSEGAPLSGAVHAVHRVETDDGNSFRYDLRVFLAGGSSAMLGGLTDADFEPIGRVPGR